MGVRLLRYFLSPNDGIHQLQVERLVSQWMRGEYCLAKLLPVRRVSGLHYRARFDIDWTANSLIPLGLPGSPCLAKLLPVRCVSGLHYRARFDIDWTANSLIPLGLPGGPTFGAK